MTACYALLSLKETRLSLPHFSITVRSLERSEVEMFLWSWISVEAWSFGLNENEELRKVSSEMYQSIISTIREETTNPINESVIEAKHRQFSEKAPVPNAIKGLGDIEREITLLSPLDSRAEDHTWTA